MIDRKVDGMSIKKNRKRKTGILKNIIICLIVFAFYLIFINYLFDTVISNITGYKKYSYLRQLEDKTQDLLIRYKSYFNVFLLERTYKKNKQLDYNQYVHRKRLNKTDNIAIIAIDEKSLSKIGRWPFRRNVHAQLIDYFTGLKYRENCLFFDVFFTEPDRNNPEDDLLFINASRKNNRVVIDFPGVESEYIDHATLPFRKEALDKKLTKLTNVRGDFNNLITFRSLSLPPVPYLNNISATGAANIKSDPDDIVRRFPLIYKYREKRRSTFLDLKPGDYADLIYISRSGIKQVGKEFFLSTFRENVFSQADLPLDERRPLDKNDIDLIKANIEISENNFQLELDTLKGKVEKNRKVVADKITRFVTNGSIPDNLQKQIIQGINDKDTYIDMDDNIKEIILFFKKQNDDAWNDVINFFAEMHDECLVINRDGVIDVETSKNESLYEIISNEQKVKFNQLTLINDDFFMSIPLVIMARYFNVGSYNIDVNLGKEIILHNPMVYDDDKKQLVKPVFNNRSVNEIRLPIDKYGNFTINFFGAPSTSNRLRTSTFDVFSYSDLLDNEQIYAKNKIILVGAFANGMSDDLVETPMGSMFGIEVIANAIETGLTGAFVRKLPAEVYLLILLGISLIIALLASHKNIMYAYVFTVVFLLIYFIGAAMLFLKTNVVLEYPKVLILSILCLTTIIVQRVLTEEKLKNEIRSIFSKYVNPSVVDTLLESPPELGGVDMNISVLFSDIRGFTSLSESLTPQELVNHLNSYLSAMTDIIMEYNGTLDKYVGDEIMCFWGAPNIVENHAELACRAALKQLEALRELNESWPEKLRLNVGVGINSGIMTVGNMGSKGRMNYTLMGDNVNLGARLEGTNKVYQTNIIVSEYTYLQVKDLFIFRELDIIRVKGKAKPVRIYELLAEKSE